VNKAAEGREDEICHCVSCLHCFETIFTGEIECAINPRMARELQYDDLQRNGDGRTVAIIGAGPAGMESARVLALRGFKPVIFEKENAVGGQLQLAKLPPRKEKITWLIEDMETQLKKRGVEVRLNTEATVEELKKLDPYAVFVATGADTLIPPIDGVDRDHVYDVPEILTGKVKLRDKSVAVIGSGMTGLETAEFLAEKGNKVTVFEMVDTIGPGVYMQNLLDITTKLRQLGVNMLPGHKLLSIADERILLEKVENHEVIEFPLDAIVLSLGVKPNNGMVETIKANFSNVKVIGDAKQPRKFAQAIREGFDEAYHLEVKQPITQ
jgi:NADPH-dependent 2,4-dienoyl-CoA reductase/sulfur reductase-like enzyme